MAIGQATVHRTRAYVQMIRTSPLRATTWRWWRTANLCRSDGLLRQQMIIIALFPSTLLVELKECHSANARATQPFFVKAGAKWRYKATVHVVTFTSGACRGRPENEKFVATHARVVIARLQVHSSQRYQCMHALIHIASNFPVLLHSTPENPLFEADQIKPSVRARTGTALVPHCKACSLRTGNRCCIAEVLEGVFKVPRVVIARSSRSQQL